MYRRVVFGALLTRPELRGTDAISAGGKSPCWCRWLLLTLWMGIYPSSFSTFFDATVTAMANQHALGDGPWRRRASRLRGKRDGRGNQLMNWLVALPEIGARLWRAWRF